MSLSPSQFATLKAAILDHPEAVALAITNDRSSQ